MSLKTELEKRIGMYCGFKVYNGCPELTFIITEKYTKESDIKYKIRDFDFGIPSKLTRVDGDCGYVLELNKQKEILFPVDRVVISERDM